MHIGKIICAGRIVLDRFGIFICLYNYIQILRSAPKVTEMAPLTQSSPGTARYRQRSAGRPAERMTGRCRSSAGCPRSAVPGVTRAAERDLHRGRMQLGGRHRRDVAVEQRGRLTGRANTYLKQLHELVASRIPCWCVRDAFDVGGVDCSVEVFCVRTRRWQYLWARRSWLYLFSVYGICDSCICLTSVTGAGFRLAVLACEVPGAWSDARNVKSCSRLLDWENAARS